MVHRARSKKSIVWIASYPRSGNTFIRLLLANYLIARFEPISLHTLKDFTFGEHTELIWQKVTGKKLVERNEMTEWKSRNAYFEALRGTTPPVGIRFVKTHAVNCMRWGSPAYNFRGDDRIIYIARNPLDVVISLAAFHGWDIERTISHMLEPFAELNGHPSAGYEVTGSWNLHVNTWSQTTACPVMIVPYFQLIADPEAWLSRILNFIDLQSNPFHVKTVAEWTQFANLQNQESRGGFPEAPKGDNRQPFFRAGTADQWQGVLTAAQVTRIVNASEQGMRRLGFTIPNDPSIKHAC